ncbi:hypothetical protein OKW21_000878 [Catalinimonas alkaloidigena]|uniref:hypothetical protein n=1 Tax=Catalinimonas alkaloidigena TaxID=1075417 RepID=UPI002405D282|nr:hypothetical protein [Catalinimonas alkaloidigena]MDF9795615.1 hypothetical protein [Catalinimonas alkaloidigena]
MTTIAEIKSTLHQYIVETDDIEVLNQLRIYFENLTQQQAKTVAYTADGKALSREAYRKDLDEAIEQADRGEVISQKDIEQAKP